MEDSLDTMESVPKRHRSDVWKYFVRVEGQLTKARCTLCGTTSHYESSTSNLIRHLRRNHPTAFLDQDSHEIASKEERTADPTDPAPVTETPFNRKNRSFVWNFYDKTLNSHKVKCRLCGKTSKYINSTSNLAKHLRVRHQTVCPDAKEAQVCSLKLRDSTTFERSRIAGKETSTDDLQRNHPITFLKQNRHEIADREQNMDNLTDPASVTRIPSDRKNRSFVWEFCEKTLHVNRVKCRLCGDIFKSINNTSNLVKHLRMKHPSVCPNTKEVQVSSFRLRDPNIFERSRDRTARVIIEPADLTVSHASEKALSAYATELKDSAIPMTCLKKEVHLNKSSAGSQKRTLIGSNRSQQTFSRALLTMITEDLLPPSIVSGSGFKKFMQLVCPRFELPSKTEIVRELFPVLTKEIKNKIKLDIATSSYFALTVESWTFKENQLFLTLTAHFIKDTWDRVCVVLDTIDYTGESPGTNLVTSFKNITDEWGITSQIIALVASHTTDIAESAGLINDWDYLPCFAYSLNQVIQNALASITEIKRVQLQCCTVASFFQRNVKALEALRAEQQQQNLPMKKLKLDMAGYWTTSLAMLTRMMEQSSAVNSVLQSWDRADLALAQEDVELIKHVLHILEPFQVAAQELCLQKFAQLSKVIPVANLLQRAMSVDMGDLTGVQLALKTSLVSQMQACFSTIESNSRMAVATLLDPRFKHHAFTDAGCLESAQQQLSTELIQVVQASEAEKSVDSSQLSTSTSQCNFWNDFDLKVSGAVDMTISTTEAEIESRWYLREMNIPRSADPLEWWKKNEMRFPHLKILAQKYLCIPATAAASAQVFTTGGDCSIHHKRNLLNPEVLSSMIFLNNNFT